MHNASVQQVAHEDLERDNCLARCLHFRYPRIQPWHLGGLKEKDSLRVFIGRRTDPSRQYAFLTAKRER
jgi:hypothetical protein